MSGAQNKFPYALNSQQARESTTHFIFLHILSVLGLLGLIGNGLLLCFYGNPSTRNYRSRDAMYIRRMAVVDLLVCIIVIPYSIFFDMNLVTDDKVCKSMEFIRHFLTYFSHLLLHTYAWELPQRHLYEESKVYNWYTLFFSLLMSLLGAFPALFIFRVERASHSIHPGVPPGSFNATWSRLPSGSTKSKAPPSCHLISSVSKLSTADFDVKSITWVYIMFPIAVLALVLYWYLMNLAAYLNSVGRSTRESLFLTNLEDIMLFQSRQSSLIGTIHDSMAQGLKRAISSSGMKRSMRNIPRGKSAVEDDGEDEEKKEGGGSDQKERGSILKIFNIKTNKGKEQESSVDSESPSPTVNSPNAVRNATPSLSDITKRLQSVFGSSTRVVKTSVKIVDNDPDTEKTDKSAKIQSRRGTGAGPQSGRNTPRQSFSKTASNESEESEYSTKLEFIEIEGQDDGPMPVRPILKRKMFRTYPRLGSYKMSFASFIMFDMVLLLLILAVYLLSGGTTVVLHLVHTKSIIFFWALSVTNPYLRDCVWGKQKCVCFPPARESKRPTQGSQRMTVQVNYVKEKLKKKHELRLQRHRRRQMFSNEFGTEI